jgi:hypothetical protein
MILKHFISMVLSSSDSSARMFPCVQVRGEILALIVSLLQQPLSDGCHVQPSEDESCDQDYDDCEDEDSNKAAKRLLAARKLMEEEVSEIDSQFLEHVDPLLIDDFHQFVEFFSAIDYLNIPDLVENSRLVFYHRNCAGLIVLLLRLSLIYSLQLLQLGSTHHGLPACIFIIFNLSAHRVAFQLKLEKKFAVSGSLSSADLSQLESIWGS